MTMECGFSIVDYVEDVMDTLEHLPHAMQMRVTDIRRLDAEHFQILRDIQCLMDQLGEKTDQTHMAPVVQKLKLCVAQSQMNGDEKISHLTSIAHIIEEKSEFLRRETEMDQSVAGPKPTGRTGRKPTLKVAATTPVPQAGTAPRNGTETIASPPNSSSGSYSPSRSKDPVDRPRKAKRTVVRPPRQRPKKVSGVIQVEEAEPMKPDPPRKGGGRKSVGRKPSKAKIPDEIPIDPDEETYCLCEQVSYGDMIGCDNDCCVVEWFHFQCVGLSNKPKGKWFCPGCRGDRQTILKPSLVIRT